VDDPLDALAAAILLRAIADVRDVYCNITQEMRADAAGWLIEIGYVWAGILDGEHEEIDWFIWVRGGCKHKEGA
jgi:hypothetical protein